MMDILPPSPYSTIALDFPWAADTGSISGAQPKVLLRLHRGMYINGYTPLERAQAHAICVDLVLQLVPYMQRKWDANPQWSRQQVHDILLSSLRSKQSQWQLQDNSLCWISKRVVRQLRPLHQQTLQEPDSVSSTKEQGEDAA